MKQVEKEGLVWLGLLVATVALLVLQGCGGEATNAEECMSWEGKAVACAESKAASASCTADGSPGCQE